MFSCLGHRMQLGDAEKPEASFVKLQNGATQLMHKGR